MLEKFVTLSKKIFQIQKGRKLLKNLHKQYKKVFVFPWESLGDIYILSFFLKNDLQEEFVLCVIQDKCKYIANSNGIKNVISFQENEINCLKQYIYLVGEDNRTKILHFYHHNLQEKLIEPIINSYKINFIECYEKFVFQKKISFIKPNFLENNFVQKKIDGPKGKTVIIAPYAKSVRSISIDFWNSLVIFLKKNGFENIYTNCFEKEKVLLNTNQIFVPLNEVYSLLNYSCFFFSIRSGLCDLVSSTNCKKFIFYPQYENYFSSIDFYSLKNLPYAKNFYEYEINENNKNEIFEDILKRLNFGETNE